LGGSLGRTSGAFKVVSSGSLDPNIPDFIPPSPRGAVWLKHPRTTYQENDESTAMRIGVLGML